MAYLDYGRALKLLMQGMTNLIKRRPIDEPPNAKLRGCPECEEQ